MSSGLSVRPVALSGREFEAFLELPYRLHRRLPNWIPPLRSDVRGMFDRRKNPFFEHAEVEAWLAERPDGGGRMRVVGRVAAIENRAHNEFHGDRVGFFGFFECENDPEAASALFEAAERWVAGRGLDRLRGPMNFSTNDDCGLLIAGFHRPPAVLMPHNPPYYEDLVEGAGFRKVKDLYALIHFPERRDFMVRAVERLKRRHNVRTRPIDLSRFGAEVALIRSLYNSVWERNWGFIPMTAHEIEHMAKQLKPVVYPPFVRFAELDGEPVAFGLALPDLNKALAHLDGRIGPWGALKLLWHMPRWDGARVLTLGVQEGHRGSGLDALIMHDLLLAGEQRRTRYAEYSWLLEDNVAIIRPLERMGAVRDKVYRIYDRPVSSPATA